VPSCFKCGEEITFNKNILSKTGKQIPLWPDQQSTHGHDEDGNATRGALPMSSERTSTYQTGPTAGFSKPKPQYSSTTTETKPTSNPTMAEVLMSQMNTAISTLTKEVLDIKQRLIGIGEKMEYNTQVDTNKLIGQLQTIEDTIAPFLKTQMKIGTELYEDQQRRQKQAQEEKYKKEQEEQNHWINKNREEPQREGDEIIHNNNNNNNDDEATL
jgi:hypothetical protein